jgi:hypothetical protein
MKNFEPIKNKMGEWNLISDDFIYNKDDRNKKLNEWRYTNRKCKGRETVSKNNLNLMKVIHVKVKITNIVSTIKNNSEKYFSNIKNITS